MAQSGPVQETHKPPTVEDVVGWLKEDGIARHLVGWKSGWSPEEVFGPPPSEPLVLGFKYVDEDQLPKELPQRDFDANAGFRKMALAERREKYVKHKLQEHKAMIPVAIKEIDRRLLQAGLSPESLRSLHTGHATDAYTKLQKLDEITGPPPPPPRIRFQILSDVRPGKLDKVDIYLQRTCTLDDFEETMIDHRLIRALLFKQPKTLPFLQVKGGRVATGATSETPSDKGFPSVEEAQSEDQKVWMYQFAAEDEQPEDMVGTPWKKIRDHYDFARLMKELLNDNSKLPLMCHESTLESPPVPQPAPAIGEPAGEDIYWADEDWNIDISTMIPDDFDDSHLFGESTLSKEEPGSSGLPYRPGSSSRTSDTDKK